MLLPLQTPHELLVSRTQFLESVCLRFLIDLLELARIGALDVACRGIRPQFELRK